MARPTISGGRQIMRRRSSKATSPGQRARKLPVNNRVETATCLSDDGSRRCSGSGKCDRYRNSPRSTPASATTSTSNAKSSIARPSSNATPPHWRSGGTSRAGPIGSLPHCSMERRVRLSLTAPPVRLSAVASAPRPAKKPAIVGHSGPSERGAAGSVRDSAYDLGGTALIGTPPSLRRRAPPVAAGWWRVPSHAPMRRCRGSRGP